ncbi:carbohydrate sulfotransferase 9-like [Polyodon spathula]|uniref:carbohydrate sulfotransferase 9-like n=1 Tax=Polyodon spathula TaxID=7913 RepID=UPI001B7E0AD8|nr:carbohydrate sulfotransferase 9-like [Polyodon spathula]
MSGLSHYCDLRLDTNLTAKGIASWVDENKPPGWIHGNISQPHGDITYSPEHNIYTFNKETGHVQRRQVEQQQRQSFLLKQIVHQLNPSKSPNSLNNSLFEDSQWIGMHKVQAKRRSFLQSFCKKYNGNLQPTTNLSQMVSRIYVEEKHKILYCEVPKAGCSNWKRTLMVLSGLAPSIDKISHNAVHYGKHLHKLDNFDVKGIYERLDSFTKVIVVRNPMERLVSAFRDKFEHPNNYYHPVFGKAIIKMYRKNATQEALTTGSGVTFKEFVQYLLDSQRPMGMDIHWETVNNLCFPCIINYDFIGKFETLEEDANHFLRLIGAPEDLKFPAFKDRHSTDERTTSSVVNHYMLQLSPAERQLTHNFYLLDYLLFNYTRLWV